MKRCVHIQNSSHQVINADFVGKIKDAEGFTIVDEDDWAAEEPGIGSTWVNYPARPAEFAYVEAEPAPNTLSEADAKVEAALQALQQAIDERKTLLT